MKTLLLLVFVVGVALCQNPKPCVTPDMWEAIRETFDRERHFAIHSFFSYDATHTRTRSIDRISFHHERRFYDILRLYETKEEYVLDLYTHKCQKHSMNEPFHKIGVEPGAESLGTGYIGGETPGTGVHVSLWEGNTTTGDYFWGAFTIEDCIPISHGFYSERLGVDDSRFFDVTTGIKNATIFDVPKECM